MGGLDPGPSDGIDLVVLDDGIGPETDGVTAENGGELLLTATCVGPIATDAELGVFVGGFGGRRGGRPCICCCPCAGPRPSGPDGD